MSCLTVSIPPFACHWDWTMNRISIVVALYASLVFSPLVISADPLSQSIDASVAHAEPKISDLASPRCDDATFLRRISLDIIGRVPTAPEVRSFVAATQPDKRKVWVDRLLANPDHAWYWAQLLDAWWMERRPSVNVEATAWVTFLRESLAGNKGLDATIAEIVAADGVDPAQRARARFLLDRDMEPTLVVRDISRLFLGANLQCAQCHDHPRIDGYKQEHFHGLMAYFNRTYLFDDPKLKKKVLGEKADGDVTFQSVFDPKKVTRKRSPGLPNGPERQDPMLAKEQLYVSAPAKDVRGVPKHSRRALLAGDLISAGREPMARNLANRIWAQMMGKGMIHPLDQIHGDNLPANPELMELLTQSVLKGGFKLRVIVRGIVLSDVYQRSSLARGKEKKAEDRLLVARLRPLNPEQMGYAILSATGYDEAEAKALAAKATPAALQAKREISARPLIKTLAPPAGNPDEFEPRLEQALFMANHAHIQQYLSPRAGNLSFRLAMLKDPGMAAEELYLSVLARLPDEGERKDVALALSSADRSVAIHDLIWALLASAEFRFVS
jgi:Protein of unknown function (DUF1549)/Protein of unknown function (DUF1553)